MIDDADDALCMLQVRNAPTAETFRYVDIWREHGLCEVRRHRDSRN